METETQIVSRPLAYRVADMLPKKIRILYYAILWLSLIYLIIRLTIFLLKVTQKLGSTIFDEKHFYFFVFVLFIIILIIFLVAQFYFDLDPIGVFWNWLGEQIQNLKDYIIENIIEKLKEL